MYKPSFRTLAPLRRHFSTTPRSQLARLTLVGRLGADAEVTITPSGQQLVKYVVGTSYGPKDNRQTSWFRVACFPAPGTAQGELMTGLEKGYAIFFLSRLLEVRVLDGKSGWGQPE